MTIRKTWEGLEAGEGDWVGLVATGLGVGLVLTGAGAEETCRRGESDQSHPLRAYDPGFQIDAEGRPMGAHGPARAWREDHLIAPWRRGAVGARHRGRRSFCRRIRGRWRIGLGRDGA